MTGSWPMVEARMVLRDVCRMAAAALFCSAGEIAARLWQGCKRNALTLMRREKCVQIATGESNE